MNMFLLFLVLHSTILTVMSVGEGEMLGKGRWVLLNFIECENHDQYEIILDLSRKKLNRTHDSFNVHLNLDREINSTYGIDVIAYKEVDGGFKFHSEMTDQCACCFMKKYTGENMDRLLTMAKLDPPDCPIPPGEHSVENFVIDFRNLPEDAIYGTYEITAYLLYKEQQVACTKLLSAFEKQLEDEDEDEDEDD